MHWKVLYFGSFSGLTYVGPSLLGAALACGLNCDADDDGIEDGFMKFEGMAAGCCLEGSGGAREWMRVGGARALMMSESSKSRSSMSPSEGSESLSGTSSMRGCDIFWC